MMYVYTEYGEKKAKEYGFNDRKAGETAYFGHEPLESGPIADAWVKKGYVRKVISNRNERLRSPTGILIKINPEKSGCLMQPKTVTSPENAE